MAHYPQYSEAENRALDLWVKLARTHSVFNKHAIAHIRSTGLTPTQFAVVECLGHRGKMTLGELSEKMLMSCGNITLVVQNLEKEHLIERIRSHTDRRVVHVDLTPEGRTRFQAVFPDHASHIQALASVLSVEEQTTLAGLLKKLGLSILD
jgi:MarR family transcriptional regulator, 2-MHQ and catechol-resistance regulon repressor